MSWNELDAFGRLHTNSIYTTQRNTDLTRLTKDNHTLKHDGTHQSHPRHVGWRTVGPNCRSRLDKLGRSVKVFAGSLTRGMHHGHFGIDHRWSVYEQGAASSNNCPLFRVIKCLRLPYSNQIWGLGAE
ncbi:hypothetical protein PIB30_008139 [Stylosanthes scabra]|uniref:Uncharacterized protein n=1 Tax=Stylosanthes scabra TaxID=79078 RepID=A0ABU6Y3B9_9FABA|nr:hypothetical protein [Stylosanthes scabra]